MTHSFSTLDEWVQARARDLHEREFDQSLRTVGRNKPLGSLAYPTTLLGFGRTLRFALNSRLRRWVSKTQTQSFFYPDHSIGQIWVYHLNQTAFDAVVERSREILQRWGCPTDNRRTLVDWTRSNIVPPKTPIFDVIADLYGDKTNPGRTDVLPDTPGEELIRAFQQVTGTIDPTTIFWTLAPTSIERHPKGCTCMGCLEKPCEEKP